MSIATQTRTATSTSQTTYLLTKEDRKIGEAILMDLRTVELAASSLSRDPDSLRRIAEEVVEKETRSVKFSGFIERVTGGDASLRVLVVTALLPKCFDRIDALSRKQAASTRDFLDQFRTGSGDDARRRR